MTELEIDQKPKLISIRAKPGKSISSEDWNERDDLRREEHEKFVRWLVGYGTDTTNVISCQQKGKKKLKFLGSRGHFFRLFLYGTHVVLKDETEKIIDLSGEGTKKDLYIFAYHYRLPILTPWNPRGADNKGTEFYEMYREWIQFGKWSPDDIPESLKFLPYSDRLFRDFSFVLFDAEKREATKEKLKEKILEALKENLRTKIEDAIGKLKQEYSKNETRADFALERWIEQIELSNCYSYMGFFEKNNKIKIPRLIFSRLAPPLEPKYPEEISVRMLKNMPLNPACWNLSAHVRRVEREKFLYWLLNAEKWGKNASNTFLLKEDGGESFLLAYLNKEEKRLSLVLSEEKGQLKEKLEGWEYKETNLLNSDISFFEVDHENTMDVPSTQENLPFSHFSSASVFENITNFIKKYSQHKWVNEEDKKIFNVRDKTDIPVIAQSNKVRSGVPVTARDFNSLDDICRFQHQLMVLTLIGHGVPTHGNIKSSGFEWFGDRLFEGEFVLDGIIIEKPLNESFTMLQKEEAFSIEIRESILLSEDKSREELIRKIIIHPTKSSQLEPIYSDRNDQRKECIDPLTLWAIRNYQTKEVSQVHYLRKGFFYYGRERRRWFDPPLKTDSIFIEFQKKHKFAPDFAALIKGLSILTVTDRTKRSITVLDNGQLKSIAVKFLGKKYNYLLNTVSKPKPASKKDVTNFKTLISNRKLRVND